MMKRLIPAFILASYAALLIKVMVFKDLPLIRVGSLMLNFGGTDAGHAPNFVPFTTIVPYLFGYKGLIIAGINLIGNIILLVPVGFLAPFIYRKMSWKLSLALAVLSGTVIETAQVILRVGLFDIDDVILNAVGVMIGYWIYLMLAASWSSPRYKKGAIVLIVLISASVLYTVLINPKIRLSPAPIVTSEIVKRGGRDLCGGTGGNGQIVSVGGSSFTLKQKDGAEMVVTLRMPDGIKSSAGSLFMSDLKTGDRVTLVGDRIAADAFTADAVLVCAQ